MIIDLKGMETTVLPNFKGGEKEYKAKMYGIKVPPTKKPKEKPADNTK